MKKRQRVVLTLLMVIPFFTTGCWDRTEIEERGTILALAIDPVAADSADNISGPSAQSTGSGYRLTAQLAIPGKIPLGPGGGEGTASDKPVWIIESTGKTIDDAINALQQKLAEKVFLGHLRIIIINKKLAQEQEMFTIQDYFRRNAEIRRLAWLLVSEESASLVMEASPKLERVPTLYLVSTMDHAVDYGKIPNVFLGNYWSVLSSQGQDPVLPLISVKGKDQIDLSGLAIFKGSKMVSQLNPLEVAGFLEITGVKRAGYAVALPLPGDPTHSVTFKGTTRLTRIKLRRGAGKPSFDIYSRIEGNIEENTGSRPVAQLYPQLSQEASTILIQGQNKLIAKMKDLKVDPFGFGEYVRGMMPSYWDKIQSREKWDEEFVHVPIRVHVEVYLRRNGMTMH